MNDMPRHSPQGYLVARHLSLAPEPVPAAAALHLARLAADTFAIAYHARTHGVGAAGRFGREAGPFPVWGAGGAADAGRAAFLNGLAAEALDYQEVLIDGRNNGHAAVVIVPALFAIAAAEGCGADDLLRALRTAFAANVVLARSLGRGHRTDGPGFRTTSLTAPIAAALGGAMLVGGTHRVAANAVGLAAAALPAGLLAAMAPEAGDFSEDKDISVGLSARHAVEAVALARAGVTAPADALAGPHGWLASYGFGDADPTSLEEDPADVDLAAYAIKVYPANFGCQCAIRLAIELGTEIVVEAIERVVVHVKTSSAASLRVRRLESHVAARFSLPYAVASALVRGRSALEDFEPASLVDPAVLAMMERVTIEGSDTLEAVHRADGTFPAELVATTRAGETVRRALATPWQGLSEAQRNAVFAGKLQSLLPAGEAKALVASLAAGDVASVMTRLLGEGRNMEVEG